MRTAHGRGVKFWLVALRYFHILSTCDLATSLLRFCNRLFWRRTWPCGAASVPFRSLVLHVHSGARPGWRVFGSYVSQT